MAVYVDLLKICRICMTDKNLNDYKYGLTNEAIADIYSYFGVKISEDDKVSQKMCLQCLQAVKKYREDRQNAFDNQIIQSYLFKKVSKDIENENVLKALEAQRFDEIKTETETETPNYQLEPIQPMSIVDFYNKPLDEQVTPILPTSLTDFDFKKSKEINRHENIKCRQCGVLLESLIKYVEHLQIKHGIAVYLKEKGIRMCPICSQNYDNNSFLKHIEDCTNSMRIGNQQCSRFGCPFCKGIYEISSTSKYRSHLMFCKSFHQTYYKGKIFFNCKNCAFQSFDYTSCLKHASFLCIYLQMCIKYADKLHEKHEVESRSIVELSYSSKTLDYSKLKFSPDSPNECDTSRRLLFKCCDYLCFNCKKIFYSEYLFNEHLNDKGEKCRINPTWFCKLCVTEFESREKYIAHDPIDKTLSKMPLAIPISFMKTEIIKDELFEIECVEL